MYTVSMLLRKLEVRDRQRLGWMDDVKVALGSIGMTVEDTQQARKM